MSGKGGLLITGWSHPHGKDSQPHIAPGAFGSSLHGSLRVAVFVCLCDALWTKAQYLCSCLFFISTSWDELRRSVRRRDTSVAMCSPHITTSGAVEKSLMLKRAAQNMSLIACDECQPGDRWRPLRGAPPPPDGGLQLTASVQFLCSRGESTILIGDGLHAVNESSRIAGQQKERTCLFVI